MQTLINGSAICLEILGFVLMLKATKTLILGSTSDGNFISTEYIDPATGKPPPTMQSAPEPKRHKTGIYLVIAGLAGQVIAMFVA